MSAGIGAPFLPVSVNVYFPVISGAPVPSSCFVTGMLKLFTGLAEYLFVKVGLSFCTVVESTPLVLLTTTVMVLSVLSYDHPAGTVWFVSFTLKV